MMWKRSKTLYTKTRNPGKKKKIPWAHDEKKKKEILAKHPMTVPRILLSAIGSEQRS